MVPGTRPDEGVIRQRRELLLLGEQKSLVELIGAAESVDEYGVEQLVGEAEVVPLQPRHQRVGEGRGGGGEGFEEGVPERSRDGGVG